MSIAAEAGENATVELLAQHDEADAVKVLQEKLKCVSVALRSLRSMKGPYMET